MSGETNDGGPAFPSVLYSHERAENWSTDGMSLRDWFAGQALAGILAGCCSQPVDDKGNAPRAMDRVVLNHVAKDAYTLADAMLAERSKP